MDIGFGGMSLRSQSTLTPGQRVSVSIPVADPSETLLLWGSVRWARPDAAGVCFDRPDARQLWLLYRLWP